MPTDPLIAAAKAYAATIYRGHRTLDGQPAAWTTLTEADRRACLAAITPAVEAAFAAAGVRLPLLPEQEPDAVQLDLFGEAS